MSTHLFGPSIQAMQHTQQAWMDASARPDPDEYGLLLAVAVAVRADCTRRRVGAVIIDSDKRLVGTGYNGAPSGTAGCMSAAACPRGRATYQEIAKASPYAGNCIALHAEENALLHTSRAERTGATMYVSDAPCPNCSRLLEGSGLARVVWLDGTTRCERAITATVSTLAETPITAVADEQEVSRAAKEGP